ncbi:MAG: NYN domain-containing protein [Chloroflexota bacterium]|nr:NYN domain-containing protein [Chloroflexota bacterium]MDE2919461.1 NYN domain-containing protein [Chloroflexota bacterium]
MEVLPRTALFLDLASLDVMVGHHGVRVAPGRLRERLTANRRLVRAVAYGVRDDDRPDSEQRLAGLAAEGFKVVAKPLRRRADGVRRASLGVDIAVDALELAPHLDALSLLTTDADLTVLIEAVQRRGVRVEVVTSLELAPPALMEAADEVVEFASLLESVRSERPGRRDMPTERGNARPRLDPPPGRRQRRRSSGRSETDAPTSASAADTSEGTRDASPPAAGQGSEAVSESAPAEPSESTGGAPDRASPRVLPQENLSGRAVRASADEG